MWEIVGEYMNLNLIEVNEAFLEDRLIDLLYMRSCGIQQILRETVGSSAGLLAENLVLSWN